MMKTLAWIAAVSTLATVLVGLEGSAEACSCLYRELEEHIADTEGIFKGEVLSITSTDDDRPDGDRRLVMGSRGVDVTFRVSEVWAGDLGAEVVVQTAAHGAACGYAFEIGRSYIVFAYRTDDGWGTGLCSATTPLENADNVLDLLGPGHSPGETLELSFDDLTGVWSNTSSEAEPSQYTYNLSPDGHYQFHGAQTECSLGTVEATGTWELKEDSQLSLVEARRLVRITARFIDDDEGCRMEDVAEREMVHLRPIAMTIALGGCSRPSRDEAPELMCASWNGRPLWRHSDL